jgi:Fur family ferric uptake transcriptional regulator
MKEPTEILSGFLSRKNLRLTSQRSLILETFLKEEGHLTSEELYGIIKRKNKSIGSATVYRTLKLLSESGIARAVDFGDGVVRYEHKYGRAHHDHLICERCNKGIEVLDERIEALQKKLARKHGFILTGHKMYLFGLCPECRKKLEQ